jgi:epoxyqueuosine reductase
MPKITDALMADLPAEARAGSDLWPSAWLRRRPTKARSDRLDAWLDAGMHGQMGWMADRFAHRESPQGLWPEAQKRDRLGMSYAPLRDPLALEARPDLARISVYAQGRDYHDVVKKALKVLARWLVAEAARRGLGEWASRCSSIPRRSWKSRWRGGGGLGWQGKHTNLVSREHGSWLFLGEIYTTLQLPAGPPESDRCGSCTACQEACPTDAFPAPYRLDARRCISYLTIEHKGPIPDEFREAIGNRIYGCDDCLAVCPWNKFAQTARTHAKFLPRAELVAPRLADFLALDDAGFALFSGSPIKRIGRDRFVRNCLIAAGNSGDAALLPLAEGLRSDPDPGVAEAADWAAAKLKAVP